MEIRNIAIIAHVDHGKTTLTDALMTQTGMNEAGITMDSNDLEKERGITIYAKNTSVLYKGTKINIVDTPGHADFGSEVERVLRSIDSVLLVVDAQEGPMPQTKFVLKKSLELGLKPIVILNKIDKPAADVVKAHDLVLELFMDLGANDDQLNFTTLYANGKAGVAKKHMEDELVDLSPILDTILEEVPAAPNDTKAPLRYQPFNLAYDNFLGRLAIGRIYEGVIELGQQVVVKQIDGETYKGKISKLYTFEGIARKEVKSAEAGDIVMIAGLPEIFIGETVCVSESQESLPAIKVDDPTISINLLVNNSPFAGRDGKFVTNSQIKERLEKELEVNVGLQIDFSANDSYKIYGRGEMHIAVLLENMRREGFEVQVSQPQVIIKDIDGVKSEPYEELIVNIPDGYAGVVIEKLAKRKGVMREMVPEHGYTKMIFDIPTRGLLGYRNQFIVDTSGEGIMYSRVTGFQPHVGVIEKRHVGSMISGETGKALGFSLFSLQERGELYIGANTDVYEGMVIGNVAKGNDMTVNPIKGKQLTNMRSSGADEAISLTPAREVTLERGLEIMDEDEYLEITPDNIRLRKQILTETGRKTAGRGGVK